MKIGVLALQGDVREHSAALHELGQDVVLVRRPAQLSGIDGIVLPGGESTTMSMLLRSSGLWGELHERLAGGLPAFGTCAGLVLLARDVLDGRPDQGSLGRLDCVVRRNGYGRQPYSFEARLDAAALDDALGAPEPGRCPLPAVFIRAPVVATTGAAVEVLATATPPGGGAAAPVVCRQGAVLATSFHPELTPDRRLHRLFLQMVCGGPGPDGAVR